MSTISPRATREIAVHLEEKKAHMLDAPVSGGEGGAIAGTLSIMVGGDTAILERCRPVLEAMGKTITYIGGHGMGQTTKLMNQILVAGNLNAVCEALVFAQKQGVDLQKAIEAVNGGAAGSWQLSNLGPKIIKRDFAPGFMVELLQKDLRLVNEAAESTKTPLEGTTMIHQLFSSLEASGDGKLGTQALAKVVERLANTEVKQK
jgi:3-hydroxyisobutyrate dehydrogenase